MRDDSFTGEFCDGRPAGPVAMANMRSQGCSWLWVVSGVWNIRLDDIGARASLQWCGMAKPDSRGARELPKTTNKGRQG